MVELTLLTGREAGRVIHAGQFPFQIGRATGCNLALAEPGVWDRHVELLPDGRNGFQARALGEAGFSVNEKPVREHVLRNGEILQLGSVQLRFSLAQPRQRSFRPAEIQVWVILLVLGLLQVGLMIAIRP